LPIGVEAHAAHFAEEIARSEFGNRLFVGEIHGSVDRNKFAPQVFFFPLVLGTIQQLAFEPADKAVLGGSVHMGARGCDHHIDIAFEHVEGGRAELAFAKNDFSGLDLALGDRATIHFQEGSGDTFENWKCQQIFHVERFAISEVLSNYFLVGERSRRTRHHAFTTGDARGSAHWNVRVEGDRGIVALAAASDDVVVANFGAGPNAAVTKDAG
jgi:hypothetical protein